MSTRQALLSLFEQSRGILLSGEELARRLGVSRAAVWKAVAALREKGFSIEAVPGGGYRLAETSDVLSAEGIRAAAALPDMPVRVLPEVDSTNLEAKRWAIEGAPHGALVVAHKQTSGRGRRGRLFESPPGGAYLSVILRPHIPVQEAVLVTAAAAVATCRVVKRLCGLELSIKWVNDLFYGNRKCSGILSEAGSDFEGGGLEYIVVGIGINYTTPDTAFAPALQDVVTSLFPQGNPPVPRAALIATIYTELLELFAALPNRGFLNEYRRRSLVLGRPVTVLASPPYEAVALSVDDNAHLVVRLENGEEKSLSSGEISIRLNREGTI